MLQKIKLGLSYTMGRLVFNRHRSRVPAEFSSNRKWVKSRPEMFIFQGLRFDLASSSGDELTYGTNCIQETYVQGTFKPNFRI